MFISKTAENKKQTAINSCEKKLVTSYDIICLHYDILLFQFLTAIYFLTLINGLTLLEIPNNEIQMFLFSHYKMETNHCSIHTFMGEK